MLLDRKGSEHGTLRRQLAAALGGHLRQRAKPVWAADDSAILFCAETLRRAAPVAPAARCGAPSAIRQGGHARSVHAVEEAAQPPYAALANWHRPPSPACTLLDDDKERPSPRLDAHQRASSTKGAARLARSHQLRQLEQQAAGAGVRLLSTELRQEKKKYPACCTASTTDRTRLVDTWRTTFGTCHLRRRTRPP